MARTMGRHGNESRMMAGFRMIILVTSAIILRLRVIAREDWKEKIDFSASEKAADSIILAASCSWPLAFKQFQRTPRRPVILQSSKCTCVPDCSEKGKCDVHRTCCKYGKGGAGGLGRVQWQQTGHPSSHNYPISGPLPGRKVDHPSIIRAQTPRVEKTASVNLGCAPSMAN